MTYEEALYRFIDFAHNQCVTTDIHEEMVATIKEALEKRIRKKPYVEFGFFCCKSCSCELNEEDDSYCHNCGQALDWSDIKND